MKAAEFDEIESVEVAIESDSPPLIAKRRGRPPKSSPLQKIPESIPEPVIVPPTEIEPEPIIDPTPAKKRGRPPKVSKDPEPPVIVPPTEIEPEPIIEPTPPKKRGRPPKASKDPNAPSLPKAIDRGRTPTPVPKQTQVDSQTLINSLADLIKRNEANVYNAKMELYKSFLP